MNLLSHLDQWPPRLIRLIAHKRKRPMTAREIAKASGLSLTTVSRVSNSMSWETVPIGTASRFLQACGVDLVRPGRLRQYLRHCKQAHVLKNPKFYVKLME